MDTNCGIYRFYNKINGKSYVGKSVDLRHRYTEHVNLLNKNLEPCTILNRAWEKYGSENFGYEVLCVCSRDELDDKEKEYIALFDSFKNGYNCTLGGGGILGYRHSEAAKEKIGLAFRGKKLSDEHKKKMSDAQIVKKLSEEHKKRLSGSWTEERKKMVTTTRSGKNNPNYRKTGKNACYTRAVMASTGECFYTVTDAAKWCGIKSKGCICTCANGRREYCGTHPVTGDKLSWSYIDTVDFEDMNYIEDPVPYTLTSRGAAVVASTGEIFNTVKEAAAWCGVRSSGNLVNCCKGIKSHIGKHPSTGEPLSWRYATFEEKKQLINNT